MSEQLGVGVVKAMFTEAQFVITHGLADNTRVSARKFIGPDGRQMMRASAATLLMSPAIIAHPTQ